MSLSRRYTTLADLYVAYRKAKVEAYYENTHVQALAFTSYEQDLQENLVRLHRRLTEENATWSTDLAFIGSHAYLPKSLDTSGWDDPQRAHFRTLDPIKDWEQRFEKLQKPAQASLRLIIRPTVDFQIVSALWIIKVGHLFDSKLNPSLSFGNRLRRLSSRSELDESGSTLNLSSIGLFTPYFSAYRTWREKGLDAIDHALSRGRNVVAMTMDIERFYHRVSPRFLMRRGFLSALDLKLSKPDRVFTNLLLDAIDTWYRSTPDYQERPEGCVPVGLSASKVISNVLLAQFDTVISNSVRPVYYGRYVDDIFLVFENETGLSGARDTTRWLASVVDGLLTVQQRAGKPPSLRLILPYAKDSELVFAGTKQKIFALSPTHGFDLTSHIREQIRIQSSEYRLLPEIPELSSEMASKALLATPDASLSVDSLRKADALSIRRHGLALLLRDLDTCSLDVQSRSWQRVRTEFFGLVERYVLSPSGFFEFSNFIPRIFGLLLACKDFRLASNFARRCAEVCDLLERTSTLGEQSERAKFNLCKQQFAEALRQTGLQAATTGKGAALDTRFLKALRSIEAITSEVTLPSSVSRLRHLARQVLLGDWGRLPYKAHWYLNQTSDEDGPPIPKALTVQKVLRMGAIRKFRHFCPELKRPHWPALVFPTRPLRADELSLVAPDVLHDALLFERLILLLRGARVPRNGREHPVPISSVDDGVRELIVSGGRRGKVTLAVTSYRTTGKQLDQALQNRPDRTWPRYSNLNRLVNRILQEPTRPDYIVFPELSIPMRWALRISRKLADNNISLIAGVEYRRDKSTKMIRNDCLVSLVTRWPGYASHVQYVQPKFVPAHSERAALAKLNLSLFMPAGAFAKPTLYVHRGFCFSVLICSDLTNISHRNALKGAIDALFIMEWNKDIKTFSSIVESASTDLHAFVAQVNNREYGDSRVRCPASADFHRDIIQVKGGETDFYVVGTIDFYALRKEQRSKKSSFFKPLPIGFEMSVWRRRDK